MTRLWSYFLFLIWFSFIISLQILLFSNGFLLSRVSQLQNSTCTNKMECTDDNCYKYEENASKTCYEQPTKAILLIIDALRYDFTVYNESITETLPYQNKLPIIHKLLKEKSQNTRLFRFIADPPTTTMQRLKALTTGTLPTFIDAGSNFATHEINEDNIIDQLIKNEHKVVFMGDDTWTGLYPNRFLRNYPYPSFNVWDLDTVDDGVIKHLFDEVKKDDWKLLVGHFLGVDHCGHRYGPNHSEMERKLKQMNQVIEQVVGQLDERTVLFVVGDHGMTSTGDHGGESENEVTSAMFVHSKLELSDSYTNHNFTVKQLDLVPTLSNLLGVPIPFSNLGATIFDCLPLNLTTPNARLHYMLSNAEQLMTYITTYSKSSSSSFSEESLKSIRDEYEKLSDSKMPDTIRTFAQFYDFIVKTREVCEKIWIQFDGFSMARGLLLVSHLSVFNFLLTNGLDDLNALFTFNFLSICFASTIGSVVLAWSLSIFKIAPDFLNMSYFVIGLTALGILVVVTVKNFQKISEKLYESSKKREFFDILARLVLIFSSLMILSNSFILEESKIVLFLLLTLILSKLVDYLKTKYKSITWKVFAKNKVFLIVLFICALLRVSVNFWQCREEQGCNNAIFLSKNGSENTKTEWVLGIVTLASFITLSRMWLKTCGNLNGFTANVLIARYGPVASTVVIGCFWILHKLPNNTKIKLIGHGYLEIDALAWTVYALIIFGLLITLLRPLFVYHLNDPKNTDLRRTDEANLIPNLAKQIFQTSSNTKDHNKTPIIYGLATVYSATYFVLLIHLVLLWSLLLGPAIVPSCISLVTCVLLYILLSGVIKLEKCANLESLFGNSFVDLIVWYLMSVYMFYGTGHQPAFPNISWGAAFIGFSVNVSHTVSAFLVLYNTFASYFIMGFALPLMQIGPFALHIVAPTLVNKRLKEELSRGEMTIFDCDDLMSQNLFKLSVNYVLCHALKMFAIMLSSTIHCRHLMVWNVFAPKFIFEAIGLFATCTGVVFGYLVYITINRQLRNFIRKLSKLN